MIKKAIKIFSLPVVLAILAIIFHFNIDQNLFTWIVEKLLIISIFITSLIAFPLFFKICKDKKLSIYESFKEVKPRLYSFWKSALLLLAVLLGYYLVFCVVFYLLLIAPESEGYYKRPDLINYILTFLFPYLLTILFGVKYIFTPVISLFEGKGFFASLWASKNRISFKSKIKFFFILLLFPALSSFLPAIAQQLSLSLVSLISLSYLNHVLALILFSYLVFRSYQRLKIEEGDSSSIIKKSPTFVSFLVGITILLVLLFFSFSLAFLNYDPKLNTSESKKLEIKIKEHEKEDNLYYLLKDGGFIDPTDENSFVYNNFKDPESLEADSYTQFIESNPEEAKEISEKNKEALDYILKAADKTHYNLPISFGEEFFTENDLLPGAMFKFARINAFEVARLAEEGKNEEALKRFLAGFKFANLIMNEESGPRFVDFLIGINAKRIQHNEFRNINLSNISSEYLSKAIKEMESLDISKSVLDRAFKLDYMNAVYMINHPEEIIKMRDFKNPYAKKFLSNSSYFYKPNETKRNFLGLYKKIINNSKEELPLSGKALLSFDRASLAADIEYEIPFAIRFAYTLPKPISEYVVKSVSGNWIGMILNDAFLLDVNPKRQYEKLRIHQTNHRLKKIALAIELYKREHDGLPDSLEQLSPDYISEIPKDPFNQGSTLKYSKEEKQIYSSEKGSGEGEPNELIFINLN